MEISPASGSSFSFHRDTPRPVKRGAAKPAEKPAPLPTDMFTLSKVELPEVPRTYKGVDCRVNDSVEMQIRNAARQL